MEHLDTSLSKPQYKERQVPQLVRSMIFILSESSHRVWCQYMCPKFFFVELHYFLNVKKAFISLSCSLGAFSQSLAYN